MSDAQRAYVTVIGGAIAILLAALSSLAIGPGPIFTFDKVVVGALLVGGLGAFGVAINIGQSPEARNARMFATAPPKAAMQVPTYSDFDMLVERIRKVEKETAEIVDEIVAPKKGEVPDMGAAPFTIDKIPPPRKTESPARPVAAGGPDF